MVPSLSTLGSPPVVLVVEDDRSLRELFRATLREEGYSVVAVADGVDALTYLATNTPAVLVLDLGLPRLSGLDVLADMAATGLTEKVPVIVVTGQSQETVTVTGVWCVLHKPFGLDELRDAVRRCVSPQRAT